jgi:hypothetical protein
MDTIQCGRNAVTGRRPKIATYDAASFGATAIVLALAILSSVYYTGSAPFFYFYCVIFVGTFIVLTIFQLGRYARFEAKAVMSEY